MAKDTIANLRRERDLAVYWLVRWQLAQQREGWEQGPTSKDVADKITDFLFNRQVDCGIEDQKINAERLLYRVEQEFSAEIGWKSAALLQEDR